jgi:hypothetical protein
VITEAGRYEEGLLVQKDNRRSPIGIEFCSGERVCPPSYRHCPEYEFPRYPAMTARCQAGYLCSLVCTVPSNDG